MESIRHSLRTASPAKDFGSKSDATLSVQLKSPFNRHSTLSEQAFMSGSNSPGSVTPDDTRNNGRATGMRGGMSQFRAQPVYSKQRLRVKQYDPSKRNYVARNDDEEQKQDNSRSGVRMDQKDGIEKPQEQGLGQQSMISNDEYGDIMQHFGTLSPTNSTPLSTSQTIEEFTPDRLAGIVSFSITKCREKHLTTLGLAIKRLWQESHSDPKLSRLFGAVLSSTATEDEKLELQELIAVYKQKAKAEVAQHKAKTLASIASPSVSGSSKTPSRSDSPPEDSVKTAPKSPVRRTRASARKNINNTMHAVEESNNDVPAAHGKQTRTRALTADEEPKPKKLKRSNSVSSGSSLSPVPSDVDHDADVSDTQKITRSSMKETNIVPLMKQDPKFKGPPKKILGNFDAPRINGKLINTADEPASQARKQKKQELTKNFDHVTVKSSHLRSSPDSTLSRLGGNDIFPNLNSSVANSRGKKKDLDDVESVASSAHDELLVPPPPEARRSSRSRQATPNAQRSRNLSARVQARIKISPQKNSNGVAGIAPRSSRSKEVNVDHSDDDDDERDNNDFCSACGSSGRLLCCDGCIRAFHFMCLDPPMAADAPPEGLWFCFNCEAKRDPYQRARRGIFSLLKSNVRKANTSAYTLPMHLREYYEGVGTGDDGEYLDVPSSGKTRNVKVPGYDEEKKQDNTKLTDKKGDAILCYACGASAMGKREIISCDYCGLYWHLDCLNPPLANPPFRDPQNRAKYRWMCPAHADSVINAAGPGGRLYKTRRPKNARIVDTQLRRGFKSNGIIEIELEDSAEESEIDDEPPIYRVTERSIRLDFNDRLRREKEDSLRRAAVLHRLQERNEKDFQNSEQAYRARSFIEKQAVSTLVELAKSSTSPASSLEPDEIKEIVDALLIEAPENVLALFDSQPIKDESASQTMHDPSPMSKELQARQLTLLRDLISEKLEGLGHTAYT